MEYLLMIMYIVLSALIIFTIALMFVKLDDIGTFDRYIQVLDIAVNSCLAYSPCWNYSKIAFMSSGAKPRLASVDRRLFIFSTVEYGRYIMIHKGTLIIMHKYLSASSGRKCKITFKFYTTSKEKAHDLIVSADILSKVLDCEPSPTLNNLNRTGHFKDLGIYIHFHNHKDRFYSRMIKFM